MLPGTAQPQHTAARGPGSPGVRPSPPHGSLPTHHPGSPGSGCAVGKPGQGTSKRGFSVPHLGLAFATWPCKSLAAAAEPKFTLSCTQGLPWAKPQLWEYGDRETDCLLHPQPLWPVRIVSVGYRATGQVGSAMGSEDNLSLLLWLGDGCVYPDPSLKGVRSEPLCWCPRLSLGVRSRNSPTCCCVIPGRAWSKGHQTPASIP